MNETDFSPYVAKRTEMRRYFFLVPFFVFALSACGGGGGSSPAPVSVAAPSPTPTVTTTAKATSSPSPGRTASPAPTVAPTKAPTASPTGSPTASPTPNLSLIKHVVIIIQENRSVDNLFNGLPGANTAQSGMESTGKTIALQPYPLEGGGDIDHSHGNWYTQWANGKLYFDLGSPSDPALPYSYVPQAETVPYWSMAEQYAFADNMFQSNTGPSFAAHQYLIAATSQVGNQYADDNPYYKNFTPIPITNAWGCDDPPGSFLTMLNYPAGPDLVGPFPCIDNETLADEIAAKGGTWREYTPQIGTAGGSWSAFDAIKHIRYGSGWSNVITPETTVLTDAPTGNIANVTWVIPTGKNSDHPGNHSNTGPAWVASVVNAIGESPDWNSTAIFITWDDWGGWFDHLNPPQLDEMGLGFRVPLVVVSPYAKHGYVSHVQYEHASILKFTEEVFGLAQMASADKRAGDLLDLFNFNQQPAPFKQFAVGRRPESFLHKPELSPPDEQ
jgi:phospholipase C